MFKQRLIQMKEPDELICKIPKSIQKEIQVSKISKNGIFLSGKNLYSMLYRIEDINALTQGADELIDILDKYCAMLNSLDCNIKILIYNQNQNMEYVRKNMLYQLAGDSQDIYRNAFNKIIEDGIVNSQQGINQKKYIMITVKKDTYGSAKTVIDSNAASISKFFGSIKSSLTPVKVEERIRIIRDFFKMGDEEKPIPAFESYIKKAHSWKDDVVCNSLKYKSNYFQTDRKFGRALYIWDYPNNLNVNTINKIVSETVNTYMSIDIIPVPQNVAIKFVENKYMGIEAAIIKQQETRNRNRNYSSDISYNKRLEKMEIEEELNDLYSGDQKVFLASVNMIVVADSKEELEINTSRMKRVATGCGCSLTACENRQREAVNTVLPYGCRQIDNQRTMLTRDLAALMPFSSQELDIESDKGFKVFYGKNQLSGKNLYGNRKSLLNGNGCIFGIPGSGKSLDAKCEMASVMLNSTDEVIIIDPTYEYKDFSDMFNGTYIDFGMDTKNYSNPLDIDLDNITQEAISEKTEFMLALIANCIKEDLSARHMSIISRCLKAVYERVAALPKKERVQPVMSDLYDCLNEYDEDEADYLHLSLEIFVEGALNIFNHHTNIDTSNRLTIYGIRDMGESLSAACMLCIIENITGRIKYNFSRGVSTWLYIDEFHELLNKEYSIDYAAKLWAKVRKLGGLCTAITQNISLMVHHPKVVTILANSEFIMLLNQSAMDTDKVCENVNGMTPSLLDYVYNSRPGTGLIKHGSVVVPFDNEIPKDNILYDLFNTNAYEKNAVAKITKNNQV